MPKVRFSLRHIMIAVAVVGVNLGLIREVGQLTNARANARGVPSEGFLLYVAYTVLPALSLITVAAVDIGAGLVKCGRARSFSTGYLLLGGLVSFGVCLDLATQSFILDKVTSTILDDRTGPASLFTLGEWSSDVLLVFVLALPQVSLGVIGGGLAEWCGLTIVRGGRANSEVASTSVTTQV